MPSRTATYRVSNNRSVSLPDGKLLRSGKPLPSGIKKETLEEWLSSGFIYQEGADPNPAMHQAPVVPSEGPLSKKRKSPAPASAPASPVKTNGKYNYDPAELEDKTLEELNLLLVDLDTDPADTEEEAIGILSSDFKD